MLMTLPTIIYLNTTAHYTYPHPHWSSRSVVSQAITSAYLYTSLHICACPWCTHICWCSRCVHRVSSSRHTLSLWHRFYYTFYVIIYMYTNSFPISYVQYRNIHRIGSDEQHWGQTRLRRTRYYVSNTAATCLWESNTLQQRIPHSETDHINNAVVLFFGYINLWYYCSIGWPSCAAGGSLYGGVGCRDARGSGEACRENQDCSRTSGFRFWSLAQSPGIGNRQWQLLDSRQWAGSYMIGSLCRWIVCSIGFVIHTCFCVSNTMQASVVSKLSRESFSVFM